jgi:uncharacterized cupredoxin-like copper-binding protein
MLTVSLVAAFSLCALLAAKSHAAGQAAIVSVTAGKPSEFSFTLSKKSVPRGLTVFKVTNRGALPHSFQICIGLSPKATANSCKGYGTKTIAPGKTVLMKSVVLVKGPHEYLCTIPGHAAAGMKGVITIT